jgi:hypothetical protein
MAAPFETAIAAPQLAGTAFAGLAVYGSFSGSGSGSTSNTGGTAHPNVQPSQETRFAVIRQPDMSIRTEHEINDLAFLCIFGITRVST